MGIKLIGYSSDTDLDGYLRHGGEKPRKHPPKRKRTPNRNELKYYEFINCCYCKVALTKENYTKEHLIPVVRGGTNAVYNLRPCCEPCNSEKDNMMLHTYIQFLELQPQSPVTLLKIENAKKLLTELETGKR